MNKFSFNELSKCARREVAQRRRVYWRLVKNGAMERADAERELAMMAEIAEFLEEQTEPRLPGTQ